MCFHRNCCLSVRNLSYERSLVIKKNKLIRDEIIVTHSKHQVKWVGGRKNVTRRKRERKKEQNEKQETQRADKMIFIAIWLKLLLHLALLHVNARHSSSHYFTGANILCKLCLTNEQWAININLSYLKVVRKEQSNLQIVIYGSTSWAMIVLKAQTSWTSSEKAGTRSRRNENAKQNEK